jgi:O-antigen/teichoic acid export membrane protein
LLQIFSSAFIYQLTKSLLPIFVVPLFISTWGELEYSGWIQAMAFVSFLSLFSLGLNNFAINRCQIAFKRNAVFRYKLYHLSLSLIISIFLFSNFASLFIILIASFFADFDNLLLILIFGAYTASSILLSYISLLHRVFEKNHYSFYLSFFYTVILYAGIIMLLWLDFKSNLVALWMLFSINLFILIHFLIIFKKYHLGIKFSVRPKRFLPYINKSYKFIYFQAGDVFRINIPIVILSYLAQPIVLIGFTVNRTLSNLQSQLFILIHQTVIQKINSNFSMGEQDFSSRELYYFILSLSFPALLLIAFGLFEAYLPIMQLWLGEAANSYSNVGIFILLSINSTIYSFWNLGTIFLVSTNNFETLSKFSFLHGLFFSFFCLLGMIFGDIYTFLVSGIICEIIIGAGLINYEIYRYLSISLYEAAKILSVMILITITYFACAVIVNSEFLSIFSYVCLTVFWIILLISRQFNSKIFSQIFYKEIS